MSKKPMVMERPQRGREMVTREYNVSDKGKRQTLALHEGYVQGQKYLVPDTDLLAMKELVDYKLGKGPKDRYVRDYEYEHQHKNEDDEKFRKMSERLHSDDSLSLTSEDDESTDPGEKKKSNVRFADEESDTEETKSENPPKEEDEPTKEEDEPSTEEDETTKEEDEPSTEEDEATTEDAPSESKKSEPEEEPPRQSKSSEPSRRSEKSNSKSSEPSRRSEKSDSKSSEPSRRSEKSDSKSSEPSKFSEKSVSKSSVPSKYSEKPVSKQSSEPSKHSVKSVSKSSEPRGSSGTTQPFNIQPPIRLDQNNDSIHFLLSGHLRSNQMPIFIFHQYTGKSVFERKDPDFLSIKNEGDTNLIIQGKFYQDSILEEENGVPKKLSLKPEKIVIDKRSKIFEDKYCELLHIGTTGVEMEGKFIRQADTKKMTPLLSFNVIHPNKRPSYSKDNEPQKTSPTTVYTSTPVTESVFERKRTKHTELPDEQEIDYYTQVKKREPQRTSISIQRSSVSSKPKEAHKSRSPKRPFKSERSAEEVEEFEPHLKKMPFKVRKNSSSRSHALAGPVKQKDAAGDVGSTGVLVYNCDVGRRRSSAKESTSVFRKLSQKIFPSR